MNGHEGLSKTAPAETVTAAPGKAVAIRLIGIQSVNSTFEVKDANGVSQSFVLHNKDGFKLPSTQTLTKLDVSPGQTMDVMLTLPGTTGSWYPQVTYKRLRDGSTYSTTYARLNF